MQESRLGPQEALAAFGLIDAEVTAVRSAWKVVAPAGTFCLRSLNREGLAKLAFLRDITAYLWERGFTRVPRFFPTWNGQVVFDTGSDPLTLISWQPGVECKLSRPGNLEAAARGLAELHVASRGFIPGPEHAPAARLGTWAEEFARGHAFLTAARGRALGAGPPTEVDAWLLESYPWLAGSLLAARQRLAELGASPEVPAWEGVFCHNSLYYQNILIEADGTTHFIDLDRALWDHRSRDLAHFLDRYLHRAGWQPEGAYRALTAYHAVWPLSNFDLGLVHVRMLFPERFLKRLRTYYGPKVKPPGHVAKRLRSLAEDGERREAFLAAFPKEAARRLVSAPTRD